MRRAEGDRAELGTATAFFTAAAGFSRRRGLSDAEIAWFHAINDLPDRLYPPVWAVMQVGALAAVPVAAAGAVLLGERRLAARLLAAGGGAWVFAKVAKRVVGRGRPATLIPEAHHRGAAAQGGGFPSGHAAVSAALAAAVVGSRTTGRGWTPAFAGIAATVGTARIYVGAHLPLDVVGGWALGVAVNAAIELGTRAARHSRG